MRRASRIVLGLEVATGLFWTVTAAMANGAGGLAAVGLFFVVYAIFAVFFLFAVWVFWKRPEERTTAVWIMLLPVAFWFAPVMIRTLAGGFLSAEQFAKFSLIIVMLAVALCWVIPRQAATLVPAFLLRSKILNWLLILAIVAGWCFLVFISIYILNEDGPRTTDSSAGLGFAIVLAALYILGLGVGNFVVATWAWVSLRSGGEARTRRLNIGQLVIAVPGILIGLSVAAWLYGQGHL
jgi:hypothetical protein